MSLASTEMCGELSGFDGGPLQDLARRAVRRIAEPFLVKLLKRGFAHRFLVAKATGILILGGVMDRVRFDTDNMICHARDRVIQMNKSVEDLGEIVLPS